MSKRVEYFIMHYSPKVVLTLSKNYYDGIKNNLSNIVLAVIPMFSEIKYAKKTVSNMISLRYV